MSEPTADVQRLADVYVDAVLEFDPVTATYLGVDDRNGELGEWSVAAYETHASTLRGLQRDLDAVDASAMAGDVAIDHALLASKVETDLLDIEQIRMWQRNPDGALDRVIFGCHTLMMRNDLDAADAARWMTQRLEHVPQLLGEMRGAIESAPPEFVEIARATAAAGREFFHHTVTEWVQRHAPDHVREIGPLIEQAGGALNEIDAWLEELPSGSQGFAIGEDLFERRVRACDLLDTTPAELAARGRAIVEETRAELDQLAASDPGGGPWQERLHRMKLDHPRSDELLAWYRDGMEQTRALVVDAGLVPLPPIEAELHVVETPEAWRHVIPYAAYFAPPPFGKDPRGWFWVTPVEPTMTPEQAEERLQGHCRASVYVTSVHEGFPGHHLQQIWANANPSRLRRMSDNAMFAEGWAFYCEELFYEHGWYDLDTRIYQLKDQLWRAVRIYADVELHTGEMSPQEAVHELVKVASLEEVNAEAEVRRYTATPTYQIAYAIGKQEFMKLRDEMKARGDFSEPKFHEDVLKSGTLPIALTAEAVRTA